MFIKLASDLAQKQQDTNAHCHIFTSPLCGQLMAGPSHFLPAVLRAASPPRIPSACIQRLCPPSRLILPEIWAWTALPTPSSRCLLLTGAWQPLLPPCDYIGTTEQSRITQDQQWPLPESVYCHLLLCLRTEAVRGLCGPHLSAPIDVLCSVTAMLKVPPPGSLPGFPVL